MTAPDVIGCTCPCSCGRRAPGARLELIGRPPPDHVGARAPDRVGVVPVNPNRPKQLRRTPFVTVRNIFGFAPVLPYYAFDGKGRTQAQLSAASRLVPATARLEVLGSIDLPRTFRTPLVPSSLDASTGPTIRLYRIRYRGPSMNMEFDRQFNDTVDGWIDATRVQ
jgi:hypothetical protein